MELGELEAMNALIGFCVPASGTWPSPLYELGYEPIAVERELTVRVKDEPRSPVLDFACLSEEAQHILCVECKSRTVSDRQAASYGAIAPHNFREQGWVSGEYVEPNPTHDLAYLTGSSHASALSADMDRTPEPKLFPIVDCDGERWDLFRGNFKDHQLQALFSQGIPLGASHKWPRHFVPFRSDSKEADMVAHVTIALSGFIIRGAVFQTRDVSEHSVPHWRLCGEVERRNFVKSIGRIIRRGANEEFRAFINREGGSVWRPIKGALLAPSQLESLQRAASQFTRRNQLGIPFGDQPTLFDVLSADFDDFENDQSD